MVEMIRKTPPPTPVMPVTETVHSVEITDPYRWLEESDDPRTQAWTVAQNAYTRENLDALPGRERLRTRLQELLAVGGVGSIARAGDNYLYTRREGTQSQPMLYVREGVQGQERMLLDPGRLSPDATTALDWWFPSPDGSLVVYGISAGGNEQSTLYVMRVSNGSDTGEAIPYTRFCSVGWLPDSSGFFYTRYPSPETVPPGEEHYNCQVYRHNLGDDWTADPLIYADADPQAIPSVDVTHDGRWLLVTTHHGWASSEIFLADLSVPELNFSSLTAGYERPALYSPVLAENGIYILTNENASRYRVVFVDPINPQRENWRNVIAESGHTLDSIQPFASGFAVHYLENATSRLRLFDYDGNPTGEIPLPVAGSAGLGGSTDSRADDILFVFNSFAVPLTAYRYTPADGNLRPFITPPLPADFDPARIAVKQVWYTSKDGTPISMFIAHSTGTTPNGARPTILTGYGGFNVSRTPQFMSGWLAWIERGGIYALANLRGGSEYGEEWHQAGMRATKQNVFDDFAAAAEYLIAEGYTDSNHLACWGGSNGGLLVGAAITQRPDLWRAAVCAVPLLDMIRYQQFQIAWIWIPEYGSSENPEEFGWLYAYSPYHHVRKGTVYPATLLTTAEGDTRVDPLHARKMTALLQAATAGDPAERPILLRLEEKAGHGMGKPLAKVLDESTDLYSFVAAQLGLTW